MTYVSGDRGAWSGCWQVGCQQKPTTSVFPEEGPHHNSASHRLAAKETPRGMCTCTLGLCKHKHDKQLCAAQIAHGAPQTAHSARAPPPLAHPVAHIDGLHKAPGLQVVEGKLVAHLWDVCVRRGRHSGEGRVSSGERQHRSALAATRAGVARDLVTPEHGVQPCSRPLRGDPRLIHLPPW